MNIKKYKKNIIFFIIIGMAIIFRLYNIETDEVMTDEGNYAMRAIGWNDFMQSGTLTTPWNWYANQDKLPFWTLLSFNDHPPMHFFFIWLSTHIFGVHLWAVRLPSVIFGIGTIVLVFLILKKFQFKLGAYCAAVFLAVLPWHIYITRQAIQESGVMFFLALTFYLIVIAQTCPEKIKNLLWILSGASLGAGIMTKYSMVVIFPVIFYWAIKKKWFKQKYFYYFISAIFLMVFPVIIYNYNVYILRHHFDLQLSRFFGMDTSIDWPASKQQLWQGGVDLFIKYYSRLFFWISAFGMITLYAGLLFIIKDFVSYKSEMKTKMGELGNDIYIMSFGMVLVASVFISLTLTDSGRSSIIIPFITLSFGLCAEIFYRKKNTFLLSIVIISIVTLGVTSLGDRIGKVLVPKNISYSFFREPLGFVAWENWQKENLHITDSPIHFTSLSDWLNHYEKIINGNKTPIIVYDQKMQWWATNWYFYRHSFYSDPLPMIEANNLIALLLQKRFSLEGKEVYYIQSQNNARDAYAQNDAFSKKFEEITQNTVNKNNIDPIIIKNYKNKIFMLVWRYTWEAGEL